MKIDRKPSVGFSPTSDRIRACLFTFVLGMSLFLVVQASAQRLDAPNSIQTFPVGNSPFGVISARADIWVANRSDNTVTKWRASDGALLGTFPTGNFPIHLAFDGSNIW